MGDNSWERQVAESEMGPIIGRSASRVAHLLLFSVLGFFVFFIFWAYNASLEEVTRGSGKIVPSGQTKKVQHLEGGIIETILVNEGEEVKKGQILLRIGNKNAEADLAEKRKEYLNLLATGARYAAETRGDATVEFPEEVMLEAQTLARNETSLFKLRKGQLEAQVNILRDQHAQKSQELNELNAKVKQLKKTKNIILQELNLLRPLVEQGISSKIELIRVEQKVQELDAELDGVTFAIPRTKSQITEAKRRINEKINTFRTEAQQELNGIRSTANRLREELSAGQDRAVRTDVRSPVSGIVKEIMKNTIGGVVRAGDDLVEIVPITDNLLVEARIRPADRAQLWPGLPATVKVSAYDFSIYGGLQATLIDISPDTITDEQGETYYRIRLRTVSNSLGEDKPIKPGMTADVDILTGEKTVLDYLLKPILKARQNALRER